MKAKDLDNIFDEGEDITKYLDIAKARRLGVPRQSIIKVWVAERLDKST
jgi:hypothetical protein